MGVMTGYKLTEVGVIPEDWLTSRLGDVCLMKSGQGITTTNIDQHSPYPCFGGNGLRGYAKNYTHDGSFALIGRQGALCGNVLGVSGRFFASEHAIVVTARHFTNIEFLTFVLRDMKLNRLSEASAQPGLSVSKLLNLQIATPPTSDEQKAIASALSDADALTSSIDELIAKKRNLKQAAMQQLLTGKTRLQGFSGEWLTKRLGTLLRFQVGFPFKSDYFSEKQQGIRLIKNRDLKNDDQRFWYSGHFDASYIVRNGDLLIGMDGDFLPCIWSKGEALLNQRVGRVFALDGLHKVFAYYCLIAPMKKIEIATAATTVKHLSHSDIENIEAPIPSYSEQAAISEVLSDMDAELADLERRRDKTITLKQGMMQELLTGKTRLV